MDGNGQQLGLLSIFLTFDSWSLLSGSSLELTDIYWCTTKYNHQLVTANLLEEEQQESILPMRSEAEPYQLRSCALVCRPRPTHHDLAVTHYSRL